MKDTQASRNVWGAVRELGNRGIDGNCGIHGIGSASPTLAVGRKHLDNAESWQNVFAGKVVLVTGASSGIGAAAARRFAEEGATVALVARTKSKLDALAREIRKAGGEAHAFPTDLSRPEECARLIGAVASKYGGIDVLVNNAGANRRGPVAECDPAELAQIVQTNLIAPIVLTGLALPELRQRGAGAIVNVASIAGQTTLPDEATYSATKHGKAKALTLLAHKLGRAVYHMLTREEAFDPRRFFAAA